MTDAAALSVAPWAVVLRAPAAARLPAIGVIKLTNKADYANKFFKINTMHPADRTKKLRVNCWGYPGNNEYLKLPKTKPDLFLWHQTGALISNQSTERGILTNSLTYNGMSGGGCSTQEKTDERLVFFQKEIGLEANRQFHFIRIEPQSKELTVFLDFID